MTSSSPVMYGFATVNEVANKVCGGCNLLGIERPC